MTKESKLFISEYLDTYGGLLSDKAREALREYYDCDMSLNEIAEEYKMTRQGVRDVIVRAESQLLEFEEKLKLCKLKKDVLLLLHECRQLIDTNNDRASALVKQAITKLEDYNGRI